ncbi:MULTISPECIES: RNA polymerase sigma factor [unclassified Roseburia]|uniref:RNA polymerase sigma factor n=1 Tax=unclassified Roseburia TaxID=2637578 RepID=UPI000E453269|nr:MULTISPECIES: RNA polymerase sigma factor [unclassified Roseburia]RGF44167.1 RNA polymerase sigma factor [Roseburia sp. AF42-8]RHQ40262.1 RNA polymerase sigma factor [Roseburia sp. AF25-18LB]RHQ40835.1 RNA polymerase sigma factor [Roseburia sp. AF25-25LB]RHQ46007.1 RNA polymerase sigma factor [Roseburia sp. AF25-13LB]RHQ46091.1 RNA polymerase sigma factor [Roseburia sp. AF25-15LB]
MNKQLLEHYIEAYGTDIYSFCIRMTQNREQAEELYQDTFLAMCEKEDWKEEGNVKSYLLGITIKLWQNRKRKFAWRKRIAAEIPISKEQGLEAFSADENLEQHMVSKEEQEAVWKAVYKLPEQLRIVILLYYMEDFKVAEIAEKLSLSISNVKSKLMRARRYLKQELEDFII